MSEEKTYTIPNLTIRPEVLTAILENANGSWKDLVEGGWDAAINSLTPAPVSVKTVEDELTPLDELINFYDNVNPSVMFSAKEIVNELSKLLPPAPVKPVGDVMRWVKATERLPEKYGRYFVIEKGEKSIALFSDNAFWSTDSKLRVSKWLEENVKPVEGVPDINVGDIKQPVEGETIENYFDVNNPSFPVKDLNFKNYHGASWKTELFDRDKENEEEIKRILSTPEQPLPIKPETITGVEEAAKELAHQTFPVHAHLKAPYKVGFKAGAEWQAHQAK